MSIVKRFWVDLWGRRRDDFDWRVDQTPLDLATIDGVLVLQLNDKLGDALMISLLVAALAKARPGLRIGVGTTPALAEYWRRHPAVAEVALLPCSRKLGRRMGRRIREARRDARPWRGRFDVAVSFEPYAVPDHFALLRTLAPKFVIGLNKHAYRLFDYSIEERRHGVPASAESVATRTRRIMQALGHDVDVQTLAFHVPIAPEEARDVEERLPRGAPRLLLNAYGGTPYKQLTSASIVRIVALLRGAGFRGQVLLSAPGEAGVAHLAALDAAGLADEVTLFGPMPDVFRLFALVDAVDAVVSPDTAVSHLAAARGKPQAVLFAERGTVPVAWRPLGERCEAVVSTTGDDVNDLDWSQVEAAVRRVLAHLSDAA